MSDTRNFTDQQIINAFAKLDQRLNYCGQNLIQLGLHIEYMLLKMQDARDSEGKPLISIDLETEFQQFATERASQIDAEVDQIRASLHNKKSGLNLDDASGQ